MKSVLRIATVDPHDETRSALKTLLLGIDTVWLEAECSRYEVFPDVVQQTQPDIALVNVDSDPGSAVRLIAEIGVRSPHCAVLVISSSQEGSLILQVMRSGASEFLNLPLQLDDFIAALDRIRATRGGGDGDGSGESGTIISVTGVCGGIGTTAVAVNMAAALAQIPGNSPVIIDLDLTLGDADVWLDIISDYTLRDVADNIDRLDYSLLKRSLTRHDCGAYLLPRPVQIEGQGVIRTDDLRRILALLKATFSHLIIDTSKAFGELDLSAMEVSDSILMVTELDLSCLRNVVRIMQFLSEYNDMDQKVEIICNRMGIDDTGISLSRALDTIGREVYWQLPNDFATMIGARNNGKPLCQYSPKAQITRSIRDLVTRLCSHGEENSATTASALEKKKSLFGLFSK